MKPLILAFGMALLLSACTADYPVSSEAARKIDSAMAGCAARKQSGQFKTAAEVSHCQQHDVAAVLQDYPGERPNADLWDAFWRQDLAIAAAQDDGKLKTGAADQARQDNLGALRKAIRIRDFGLSGGRNLQRGAETMPANTGCETQTPYTTTVYTDCH